MLSEKRVVENNAAGTRLDVYLARYFFLPDVAGTLSRASIQRLIDEGQVTVNGRKSKSSARLRPNDVVYIEYLPPREASLRPEPLPLDIIHEDGDCLVINKAPGMVVHPAAGCASGTLVNALLHHCEDLQGIGGERRPGIVHRLDKETSGVMIVAKNAFALERLARQFKLRTARKEYLALVWGTLPAVKGVVDRPIGRHRSTRKKMSSIHAVARSREALTEWQVERSFSPAADSSAGAVSWLRLRPKTGRTHQIRVHLADLGHAIVGDKVYGRKKKRAVGGMAELLESFPRQALHAETLAVDHPRSGMPMTFSAPLPDDLGGLLRSLEALTSAKAQKGVDKNSAFKYYTNSD
jgi:23S rRNA pseudouridine1911/1915/1917 synthase